MRARMTSSSVTPLTGKPLRPETVSSRFKRALVKAGVGKIEMREYKVKRKVKGRVVEKTVKRPFSNLRLHDLRHSFGTTAAMNPSISLKEIQQWMGHKDPSTTAIYSHFQPKADAAERLGNAFKTGQAEVLEQPVVPAPEEN
jgi:integrase